MSILFPDKVRITPVTIGDIYRKETEGETVLSIAFVEESGVIKYSSSGKPIDPEISIFLPGNAVIKQGDSIETVELHGETPTTQEAKKREVKRVHRAGAYGISHIEVLV